MKEILVECPNPVITSQEIQQRIIKAVNVSIRNKGRLDFLVQIHNKFTILEIAPNVHQRFFFAEVYNAQDLENQPSDLKENPFYLTVKDDSHNPLQIANALVTAQLSNAPINIFLSLQDFFKMRPIVSISSPGKLMRKKAAWQSFIS